MNKLRLSASAILVGAFVFAALPARSAERFSDEVSSKIAPVAGALPDAENVPALGKAAPVETAKAESKSASAGPLRVPQDSRRFLPDYMTKAAKGMLLPKDSSMVQERAEALAEHFRQFYPDVTYHIEWDDDTVNAYAWQEYGGEKHVALLGGLLRHKVLMIEGIALVLAHEIGHHYGGKPTYSSGMSCEGQADYWSAGIAMRRAYSDNYRGVLIPAVNQINTLFTGGVESSAPEDEWEKGFKATAGCSHPPAACRKETYLAAMDGKPKPECAGPTEEKSVAKAPASEAVAFSGI